MYTVVRCLYMCVNCLHVRTGKYNFLYTHVYMWLTAHAVYYLNNILMYCISPPPLPPLHPSTPHSSADETGILPPVSSHSKKFNVENLGLSWETVESMHFFFFPGEGVTV